MKKPRRDRRHEAFLPFLDLLFNVMLAFVFLFIVAFILINNNQKKTIEPKAEAMIVFTWPDWAADDLDVWVQLPNGQAVWWQNKNGGLVNLERDDIGLLNDITIQPGGTEIVVNPINREVAIFRGMVPGTYQVNIHFYLKRPTPPAVVAMNKEIPQPPYPVTVEMVRLNPSYQSIVKVELTMEQQGQEKSAFGFTITPDGQITNIDHVERKFVISAPSYYGIQ